MEILNQLLRGLPDYWELRIVLDIAATAIEKAAPPQAGTAEYDRLRTALLERGAGLTSSAARQGTKLAEESE